MHLTERERLLVAYGRARGRREMAWDLAIWKSGSALVGVMERPYKEFVAPYVDSMVYVAKEIGIELEELDSEADKPVC